MNRKTVLILGIVLFLATVAIIFMPSLMASNKENKAVESLNELYNEDFAMAKSTAGKHLFGDAYEITVQSLNTNVTYDFEVDGDNYIGNYYGENINVEINKLLEQRVDGLVMTNAHIEASEAISYKEAGIEQVDVNILTNEALPTEKVDELAMLLKKELGDIPINLEVMIVVEESTYEGVRKEIEMYFQLSAISMVSFENVTITSEKYQY